MPFAEFQGFRANPAAEFVQGMNWAQQIESRNLQNEGARMQLDQQKALQPIFEAETKMRMAEVQEQLSTAKQLREQKAKVSAIVPKARDEYNSIFDAPASQRISRALDWKAKYGHIAQYDQYQKEWGFYDNFLGEFMQEQVQAEATKEALEQKTQAMIRERAMRRKIDLQYEIDKTTGVAEARAEGMELLPKPVMNPDGSYTQITQSGATVQFPPGKSGGARVAPVAGGEAGGSFLGQPVSFYMNNPEMIYDSTDPTIMSSDLPGTITRMGQIESEIAKLASGREDPRSAFGSMFITQEDAAKESIAELTAERESLKDYVAYLTAMKPSSMEEVTAIPAGMRYINPNTGAIETRGTEPKKLEKEIQNSQNKIEETTIDSFYKSLNSTEMEDSTVRDRSGNVITVKG